ncbi:holo-[acyl-carrier-protein] synthase [Vallitalea longa]|uniref:Holo-[acyl-carrier-protein] synthase n=1 Tax=Vallitalea longa TaxID=2936439 RepID=A0A9W5YF89_9FIRM|nr:holo-ACP synthase [Vallitalea longa]GKX31661.1 holo-[acyl-carrier-protein] synthase [Vallitalea longa]
MIKGIGNDIIEISRIEKAIQNERFLEKYFTLNENRLFEDRNLRPETIAGNFATKEAVSKVLGTGFVDFSLADIEVLRDDMGKPYVILYNNARSLAEKLNISRIHVSISHSKEYVIATALGE